MHFVTGGAFNGKRAWVKKNYPESKWLSAYNRKPLVLDPAFFNSRVVVLEGLEEWIREDIRKTNVVDFRDCWRKQLSKWSKWEKMDLNRQVVLIGTDITKGIVPMEEVNRTWRDITGWVYQDLAAVCNRVDVVWYGINQTIKGDDL